MRTGQNPNRTKGANQLEQAVFLVVTHLPNVEDHYHKDRLEVIQLCLNSMRHNANYPHSFMVWDNGSCNEFRSWMQYEFRPDVAVLSHNVGKTTARTNAIKMLPPDSIVAYSDDDILYFGDWFLPQLEILEHFPNVSVVTGYPVRTSFRWANENTVKWAEKNADIERGQLIPREWENDFCESIGRDPDWHVGYTKDDVDLLATYEGKQAYLTSHHCQFVAYADRIKPYLQYDNMAMGDERPFDYAMDEAGLRLATVERYARHIGNKIDEKVKEYA